MKRIILFAMIILWAAIWAVPSFAQTNSIHSVSVHGTSCGGGGWVTVTFAVDGSADHYVTATATNTIARNVSNRAPGVYTEEFYLPDMDSSAVDYAIRVTVRLGTSPSSSYFDNVSLYFDCRDGALLIPTLDARDNRYTIPRNTPIELHVARNDVSALPLRNPRVLTQPIHADVVMGENRRLVVTADSDYIGADSFTYEICDISGLCDTATVRLTIANMAPTCDAAADNTTWYWSPNHEMVQVQVNGVIDPDGDAITLVITAITVHDSGGGSGNTDGDYDLENGLIRVERSGQGDGRTYEIAFEATDIWGATCSGVATIYVPHDRGDMDGEPSNAAETETEVQGGNGNGNGNGNSNGNANGNANGNGGGGNSSSGGGRGSSEGGGNGNSNGNGNGNSNGNANGRGN